MFEMPLHPLFVHFPIVLATMIPFLAIIFLIGIKRGYFNPQVWVVVVIIAALYTISSLVAVELGEDEEDIVKKVVAHAALEEHEEAGEMIPWVAGGIFLISLTPLALKYRTRLQLLTVLVSALGLAPVIEAGHSGGLLVFEHGAPRAYRKKLKPTTDSTTPNKYIKKPSTGVGNSEDGKTDGHVNDSDEDENFDDS